MARQVEQVPSTKANGITLEEVQKHQSRTDIWLTIHGKVYNVTSFVDDHPGGEDILFEHAGLDVTEVFEDIGHSASAHDLLANFYIGELCLQKDAPPAAAKAPIETEALKSTAGAAQPSLTEASHPPLPPRDASPPHRWAESVPFLVGLGLLAFVVGYQYYMKT